MRCIYKTKELKKYNMANRFKEIKMISSLEKSFDVTQKLFTQNDVAR